MRESIGDDGDDRHADTGDHADTEVAIAEADVNSLTEPVGTHQRGNHEHRDTVHNGLVEPEHHDRQRKRQLNPPQQLPAGATNGGCRLDHRGRYISEPVLGIADRRHYGVGHDRQQRREFADFEDHDERDQDDEQRHRLQRVVDRAQEG